MNNSDLFPNAAPDFSDPIGLLRACHSRILNHCATLERLAEHLKEKGADADARSAAGSIHRYFSSAGRHHHEDEEVDLFPLLARQSLKLADMVHRLHKDHGQMDALWQQLATQLLRLDQVDPAAFAVQVDDFTALYRDHIARENDDLLQMAQHILGSAELKKLGERMAERRRVKSSFD